MNNLLTIEEFKELVIEKFNCNRNVFEKENQKKLLQLLYKYYSEKSKVESKHINGLIHNFKNEISEISSLNNNTLYNLISQIINSKFKNNNTKKINQEEKNIFLTSLKKQILEKEITFQHINQIISLHKKTIIDFNILPLKQINIQNICKIANIEPHIIINIIEDEKKHKAALKAKEIAEQKRKEKEEIKNTYLKKLTPLANDPNLTYQKLKPKLEPYSTSFLDIFGQQLSLSGFCNIFNLPREVKNRLTLEKEKEDLEIEKAQKWKDDLLHSSELIVKLKIKKVEFNRWREDGRIPISKTQSFNKWGKDLTTTFHHPNDIKHITPDLIENWRIVDKEQSYINRKNGALKAQDKTKITKAINKTITKLEKKNISLTPNKQYAYKLINIPYLMDNFNYMANIKIYKQINLINLVDLSIIEKQDEYIEKLFLDFNLNELSNQISEEINKIIFKIPTNISLENKLIIIEKFIEYLSSGFKFEEVINSKNLLNILEESLSLIQKLNETEKARKVLQLEKYEESFPNARKIKRSFNLIFGPTNSGKTYQALETLKKANSGVYLAPLRLLAMEVYDKLNSSGVPCNLITGEEHILVPNAKHTASTVEMLNIENIVDVAVIDEIQMLSDTQRGWAWTAALVGVPAKKVYCVGSIDIKKSVTLLLDYLKEDYLITELERQCPLIVEKVTVKDYNSLIKGDVLIAFSRKEVLFHSNRLKELGFSVSTIYGALAPEVRRKQADMFLNGKTNIMVSTDAIGMGLNLPAKRIIFTTIEKYDGENMRNLFVSEIKQIAGRAGRFGLHKEGFVSAFKRDDLNYIRDCLNKENPIIDDKLSIAPSLWHVEKLSEILNVKKLPSILTYFSDKLKIKHNLFDTSDLSSMIELSSFVEQKASSFDLKDKFTFSCVPISLNSDNELLYLEELIIAKRLGKTKKLFDLPNWIYEKNSNYLFQAEELTKKLTIYAWLSFKYPKTFNESEKINTYRKHLSHYIIDTLSKVNIGKTYFD